MIRRSTAASLVVGVIVATPLTYWLELKTSYPSVVEIVVWISVWVLIAAFVAGVAYAVMHAASWTADRRR